MRPIPILVLCLAFTLGLGCDKAGEEDADMGTADGDLPADFEGYTALCAEQQTQAACEAVPSGEYSGDWTWCFWQTNVAASFVDNVCEFGEVTGECVADRSGEIGCTSGSGACGSFMQGQVSTVEGELVLSLGSWCGGSNCNFDEMGQLISGPDACVCFCDENFPSQ